MIGYRPTHLYDYCYRLLYSSEMSLVSEMSLFRASEFSRHYSSTKIYRFFIIMESLARHNSLKIDYDLPWFAIGLFRL